MVDVGLALHRTTECRDQTAEILSRNGMRSICRGPFHWYFVGWDGDYYLCSHEYRKMSPTGNVRLQSVAEIQAGNMRGQLKGLDVYQACEFLPVNRIQEMLLRVRRRDCASLCPVLSFQMTLRKSASVASRVRTRSIISCIRLTGRNSHA